MSRYMQMAVKIHPETGEQYEGWESILDDADMCRHLVDEVCTNADCEKVADFPDTGYCSIKRKLRCPHFEEEDR